MTYLEPELIEIAGGEFIVGTPACPDPNKLAHPWHSGELVTVAPFRLGKFSVTNAEYRLYLADTKAVAPVLIDQPNFNNDRQPVLGISWEDAIAYCCWLSMCTGKSYRLPRDAEWEFSARGGRTGTRFPWGDELSAECACFAGQSSPRRVGSYPPNGYGLHDMIGNAWQWCEECFNDVAKLTRAINTPTGTQPEMNRIVRGGSYMTKDPLNLHIPYRHEDPPDLRHPSIGFRIAMDFE